MQMEPTSEVDSIFFSHVTADIGQPQGLPLRDCNQIGDGGAGNLL